MYCSSQALAPAKAYLKDSVSFSFSQSGHLPPHTHPTVKVYFETDLNTKAAKLQTLIAIEIPQHQPLLASKHS